VAGAFEGRQSRLIEPQRVDVSAAEAAGVDGRWLGRVVVPGLWELVVTGGVRGVELGSFGSAPVSLVDAEL